MVFFGGSMCPTLSGVCSLSFTFEALKEVFMSMLIM